MYHSQKSKLKRKYCKSVINSQLMENPNCVFLLFYIANILKITMEMYPKIVVNILIGHKDIYITLKIRLFLVILRQY